MNISLLTVKAVRRARNVGLRRFITELPKRVFGGRQVTDFDARNGTNTDAAAPLWKFRLPFASAQYGAEYRSPPETRIMEALVDIPRHATFVDLGSGKGRALIVAARLGFAQVIGVEFVAELAEISRRNLEITGLTATVLVADAGEWAPPSGPLCVYLYSPFSVEVMRRVSEKMQNRTDKTWVAYLNPTCSPGCAELFDAFMQRVTVRQGLIIWAK